MCALFLAAALAHLRAGGLASLAAASVFAGVLIAIRPGGYAVLPVLAVLLLGRRHAAALGVWKRLLAAIIPALVMLALESVYYAEHHPGPRQSLAPIHLLGKAAMIEVPETAMTMAAAPAESLPLRQALASAFAPVRRLIAEAPNQPARCLLDGTYELFAQYGFAPEERALAMTREGPDALTRIALERLRHGMGGYLWLSINELVCMWTLGAADAAEQSAMYAYVEGHRPLPFEADILSTLQSVRQPPFAALMRLAMYGIAALLAASGLALIITLARRREPGALLAAGGLCGLVVHAALVLTALTGVGIPRYVLGLWVPMAVGTGLSGLWILELCRSYRPSRRRNIDARPATDLTARDLS
jgi:hypothetical protein